MSKAIVKRNYKGIEDDLIFRSSFYGYYFPNGNSICVYDRKEDNFIICQGMYESSGNMSHVLYRLPEYRRMTVSQDMLESIKQMIRESGVMNIRSFEEVEYDVMDGEANLFYFSVDGKRKLIECDNFYMLYSGSAETSAAIKVMKLVDDVLELLGEAIKESKLSEYVATEVTDLDTLVEEWKGKKELYRDEYYGLDGRKGWPAKHVSIDFDYKGEHHCLRMEDIGIIYDTAWDEGFFEFLEDYIVRDLEKIGATNIRRWGFLD